LELRRKLVARGFAAEVVERVLRQCAEQGWQSDERFAENYLRSRKARGFGGEKIRRELRLRGIDPGYLEFGKEDWLAAVGLAYAKKYGEALPASPREWASRTRFLLQRGFSAAQIRDFFRRLGAPGEFPGDPDGSP
jgi:regulatory protein